MRCWGGLQSLCASKTQPGDILLAVQKPQLEQLEEGSNHQKDWWVGWTEKHMERQEVVIVMEIKMETENANQGRSTTMGEGREK